MVVVNCCDVDLFAQVIPLVNGDAEGGEAADPEVTDPPRPGDGPQRGVSWILAAGGGDTAALGRALEQGHDINAINEVRLPF